MRSFLQWLVGADDKAFSPDAELSLRFDQAPEGWMVLLAIVGVVLFVWMLYRRDGRDTASPVFRTVLGVLRAGVIALALFILSEPSLVATQIETRRSAVVLLIDDSYSMDLAFADAPEALRKRLQTAMGNGTVELTLPDGKTQKIEAPKLTPEHYRHLTRLDVITAALGQTATEKSSLLDRLNEQHDVRVVTFARALADSSERATTGNAPKKLVSSTARGSETRIGDALRSALKDLRGQPLAGVVLLTDGRQTGGEDAVQAAGALRNQRIPLMTVGVGDPSEPRDFELTVEGPDMILPNDPSEVTAFVRFKGYTGISSIKVEMKNGANVVASADVKLGNPGEKIAVPLQFREALPGKFTYTLRIPEQQGELRSENNAASYSFQVVDKKVKILFVEGQDLPRWEYRYLKNALRRDHTTEVDVLLSSADGTFTWDGTDGKTPLEQFPVTKKEISEYDVLIFGDVNPQIFTADQVKLIREFVREGGGFIMIAGERFAPAAYTGDQWADMLPVVPQGTGYEPPEEGFQEPFTLELTPEGERLAWTHFDPDKTANREMWDNLPRLYWFYPVKRRKELATVIAAHADIQDESRQKMPIIATMPYGSGRTMYIGVDSLWRWRRGIGDRYHYRFYNQAIRHLSMAKRLGGQRRFYLGTDRATVGMGDPVILTAVLRDENFKELSTEKALAYGRTPKGEEFTVELKRLKDRPGTFEGSYFPTQQGEYQLWLRDELQPGMRHAEVNFKAEKPQLEFENPRMDRELLENIARAGGDGGKYFDIDRIHEIPRLLPPAKLEIPRATAFTLWDKGSLFLIFTALLTAEWILRKRGRMI